MWESISYVSSGLTLVAFIIAAIAKVYSNRLKQKERLISLASESERTHLVANALEFFNIDTSNLTKGQQFELAKQQISNRAKRFYVTTIVVVIIAILGTALSIYAIFSSDSKKKEEPVSIGLTVLNEDKLNDTLKSELDSFKLEADKEQQELHEQQNQKAKNEKKEFSKNTHTSNTTKNYNNSRKKLSYQEIIRQEQRQRKRIGGEVKVGFEYERPHELRQYNITEEWVMNDFENERFKKGLLTYYEYEIDKGKMIIKPRMGYLDKINADNFVNDTFFAWITWQLPIITAVINNPTQENLVILDLEIEVLSSKVNIEPLIIANKIFEKPNDNRLILDLDNLGWGKVKNASIEIGFRDSLDLPIRLNPDLPKEKIYIGDFDNRKKIETNIRVTDELRAIKNPRALAILNYENEYGNPKKVKFDIELALTKNRKIYDGGWAHPGYLYNIKLENKSQPFSIHKNVSQIIKPNSVEVLALSFYSARSSFYQLKLKFRKNNGEIIESNPIELNTIMGRSVYNDGSGKSNYHNLVQKTQLPWSKDFKPQFDYVEFVRDSAYSLIDKDKYKEAFKKIERVNRLTDFKNIQYRLELVEVAIISKKYRLAKDTLIKNLREEMQDNIKVMNTLYVYENIINSIENPEIRQSISLLPTDIEDSWEFYTLFKVFNKKATDINTKEYLLKVVNKYQKKKVPISYDEIIK